MKTLLTLFILLQALYAQDYFVVAHKDVKDLTSEQIRAIFLKKLFVVDGRHLVPINLQARDSTRQEFEHKIVHMNFQRMKSYWAKQHYQGHRPPLSMRSEDAVLRFIQKVEGSLGYVSQKPNTSYNNIKIIYKWSQ